MIQQALQAAGYDGEPNEENLIDCYMDYASAYGQDLDDTLDDINTGIITTEDMCKRLIRSN